MSKSCPQCGQVFPESARYCDQDGATLVLPGHLDGRRKPGLRKTGIAVIAVLLLLCGVALPWLAKSYLRWKVDVVLESASLQGTAEEDGARPRDLLGKLLDQIEPLLEDPVIALQLRVRNGSPLRADLVSASYAVEVGEREAATGIWTPEPGPLPFGPGEELPVDLTLHPNSAFGLSSEMFQQDRPLVRVHGDLTIKVWGMTFALPFEVRQVRIEWAPGRKEKTLRVPEKEEEPALKLRA